MSRINVNSKNINSDSFSDYTIPERYVPNTGDTIGKYKVLSKLGEGSFGNVYKVQSLSNQKVYALKLLKVWEITYEEERKLLMQRFKMEYETGKIQSCYLVNSKEYGKVKGNPYIIMEYCNNGDMRAKINQGLSVDFISKVTHEVLLGLKDLHENGKIHRDMKPENVLLDVNQQAKLTDFGIAGHKNMRMTKRNLFGRPQEIFGTYAYMPPEQLKPREATKLPTTDIFSFGVMIFEMFTGKYPFGNLQYESDLPEYVVRINQGKWDNIQSLRSDVPTKWKKIIEKCLHPNYKDRFQSVDELLETLGKPVFDEKINYNSVKNQLGLKVMQGKEYRKMYNLSELIRDIGKLTLGRDDAEDAIYNDINVEETPPDGIRYFISRQHATIEKMEQPKGWFIRDGQWIKSKKKWKESLNGTYVNSEKAGKNGVELKVGDIITVGDTTLKVTLI